MESAHRGHTELLDVPLGDGRVVRVRRRDGIGAPLVLLHGLLDSSEGWLDTVDRTHRPCLAIDLPGFGGSSRPLRPRISSLAEDVSEALDHLDVGDFTLVGHSLGGAVATAVAERRPDRAHALVLLAPAGFGVIPLADLFTLPGVRDVATTLMPLVLGNRHLVGLAYRQFVGGGNAPDPELVDRLRGAARNVAPGVRDATFAIRAAGRSPRAFHRRRLGYDGSVLALWGDRDALVPVEHATGVRRALPQARVDVWTGMGHHPQRERPDELSRLIEYAASRARATRRLRRRGSRLASVTQRTA